MLLEGRQLGRGNLAQENIGYRFGVTAAAPVPFDIFLKIDSNYSLEIDFSILTCLSVCDYDTTGILTGQIVKLCETHCEQSCETM